MWRIVIRYANPAPAARKVGRVQPAVVVHEASVRRARELSNFRPGEWRGMSAVHVPGSGWGNRPLPISRNYKKKSVYVLFCLFYL